MRKNILIIRSANFSVIDLLIDYILKNNERPNIFFISQEAGVSSIKERFLDGNIYIYPNGSFNYKTLNKNKHLADSINKIIYDEIYMPSSYENFDDFQEIKLILSTIKREKTFSFNCYGKITELSLDFKVLYFNYKFMFPFKFIFSLLVTGIVCFISIISHIIKYHVLKNEV